MQVKLQRILLAITVCMTGIAGAAAQTTITPAERETALKSLQATHDAFLKAIAGLSEKQWKFKPGPDRWSVAEVSEHIALSESTIFGLIQVSSCGSGHAGEPGEDKVTDELILAKVPDRSRKVQAPEFLQPTGRFASREATPRPSKRRAPRRWTTSAPPMTTCAITSARIPTRADRLLPVDSVDLGPQRTPHQADRRSKGGSEFSQD